MSVLCYDEALFAICRGTASSTQSCTISVLTTRLPDRGEEGEGKIDHSELTSTESRWEQAQFAYDFIISAH
jgi:hypothetical protein